MQVQDFPVTLDAGVPLDVGVLSGVDFIAVITAPDVLEIKIAQSDYSEYSQGDVLRGSNFQKIFLRSATTQAIRLKAGVGDFSTKPPVSVGTVNSVQEPSNTLDPMAEVTLLTGQTKLLAAASVARKELRMGVKSSEANGVYFGDASVGVATPGGYIEEGTVDYVAMEGAVYGYNAGAVSITVNVLSLERP